MVISATEGAAGSAMRALMPPYLVIRDFLEADTVARLLAYTLENARAFEPTQVRDSERRKADPTVRVSVATRDLGPFRPILKSKVLDLVPDLVAKLRTNPVDAPRLELQLVAHGDGAFYKRHIDTRTASDLNDIRLLSGVYYFHVQPRAFTGGALRLYAIGDPAKATFADIEPEHNTLLVFPSWALHEVMPVSCPSRQFADSRFAINCWIYRSKPET
ncbi:MAG TPA: 2OG-Fe(II) oxygenase [Steroidobacteraceae bacterium]|jgi:Rps23 Pro-64 3,4-dihydroxylase Tpa1-like proline 4-hydroxylase|nr:2OG-Fe(II) oxygenase [Steroidobacteraceae bacterium]